MSFLYESGCILAQISIKFVPNDAINDITTPMQIMTLCRLGGKPLFEHMMVKFAGTICIART